MFIIIIIIIIIIILLYVDFLLYTLKLRLHMLNIKSSLKMAKSYGRCLSEHYLNKSLMQQVGVTF